MLRNYLKIALRNLSRHKVYSLINIVGLWVGMSLAMLIGLWMYDELSYDSYHLNRDRIAMVMQHQTFDGQVRTWDSQPLQLGPELRSTYGSYFKHVVMGTAILYPSLSVSDKTLIKSGSYLEPEAPEMLTLKMLHGTRLGLKSPNSIMLSESVSKIFFGNTNPLGKQMTIDHKLIVQVTGVYEDLPQNTSLAEMSFIAPWELLVKSENYESTLTWGNSWFRTFVQLADGADMHKVSSAIKMAKLNRISKDDNEKFKPELFLHPMSRWHLYDDFQNGVNVGGRIEYVWMYGVIGVFVLLLACINFMNLSTARSSTRVKEVGIRKTVGSVRRQIISQFFSESLLVTFFALGLTLLLVELVLPLFNAVAGKKMIMPWANPWFWVVAVGFSLFTGLIAGSYPALYLSSFAPIKVLKGTFRAGRSAAISRKVLVVVQFTVSITLIIGTLIVFRQIQHTKNRPVGYKHNGLLSIPMKTDEVRNAYEAIRNDLTTTRVAVELSQSESLATNAGVTNSGLEWEGKQPGMQDEQVTVAVSHEFGKTIDWKLKEGRDFSRAFSTDSSGIILNEAAVSYMGFSNPIGQQIKAFGRTYHVIGVVENMVMESPYEPVRPTIFYIDSFKRVFFINVRINPLVSVVQALNTIETVFKKHCQTTPFEFWFAEDEYESQFRAEQRIGNLASSFAVLAIFISCLGLFGLASFVADQRTKELGIRKVLGASATKLWQLLIQDFALLVLISLFIAAPISFYGMHEWIERYYYRTELSWWIFVLTAVGVFVIALLTVSYQAIRAALLNPVNSLRSE